MACVEAQRERRIEWGTPASLALHGVLLVLLLVCLPKPRIFRTPPDDSVSVDIVAMDADPVLRSAEPSPPSSGASVLPPARSPAEQPLQPLPPPIAKPTPSPDEMAPARQLFSSATLSDPRSKQARAALRQLSGDERKLQLCGLEAMEQVRRSQPDSNPDAIAPYAMAPEKIKGDSVDVEGGAFRSKGLWYAIRFHCEIDDVSGEVGSFAFAMGTPIPRDIWQEHNLVADDGAPD